MTFVIFYFISLYAVHATGNEINKPNIVFIVGDDIGWDDISLHGSNQIITSNIDMLGYQGIMIPKYYTDAQGTPSRSALFTGKYPMRMGTQGVSIGAAEDRGIPLSERLLPSYLKDLGYATHLVGKWQLGKSREHFLPTNRGFDTFYGFTGDSVDYYTYNQVEICNGSQIFGLNLFDNLNPVLDQKGHLTNILTDRAVKIIREHNTSEPLYLHLSHAAAHIGGGMVNLQVPIDDVAANGHIAHTARRMYAGLVTGVDKSVGKIVAALADVNMLNYTIIVFVSDNGAASTGALRNYGSNLPLRGTKATPWEGAVRSTAVLWHAALNPKAWDGLFHVTDWLPTLIAAAGGDKIENIDGINHWDSIVRDEEPLRHQAIIAVDDLEEWGAFRDGDFKIIIGNVGNTYGYYGQELNEIIREAPSYKTLLQESETAKVFAQKLFIGLHIDFAMEKRDYWDLHIQKTELNNTVLRTSELCVPTKIKGCLFNISADPEEAQDLWDKFPDIVQHMSLRFRMLWSELVPRRSLSCNQKANPALHNYIWYPWLQNEEDSPPPLMSASQYPFQVSIKELQYFMDLNLQVFKDKLDSYFKSMADTLVTSFGNLF